MMNCAEAQKRIKPYLESTLPDSEMAAFLEHVHHCADCYDELEINLAINETLKHTDDADDPKDYDFQKKLRRELENSAYDLKIRKSQTVIGRGVILLAVLIMGALIYTGLSQRKDADLPAWETEGLSEEMTESRPNP